MLLKINLYLVFWTEWGKILVGMFNYNKELNEWFKINSCSPYIKFETYDI
jgi:hypothetical protein